VKSQQQAGGAVGAAGGTCGFSQHSGGTKTLNETKSLLQGKIHV